MYNSYMDSEQGNKMATIKNTGERVSIIQLFKFTARVQLGVMRFMVALDNLEVDEK